MIMNKTIMKCMVLGLLFAGCENGDKEFDDYEYQTISFATQTPIRTITLGEDVYPTEQDNEYRMQIIATLGGVWSNRKERTAQIVIDESLCTNAYFDNGKPIAKSAQHRLLSMKVCVPMLISTMASRYFLCLRNIILILRNRWYFPKETFMDVWTYS